MTLYLYIIFIIAFWGWCLFFFVLFQKPIFLFSHLSLLEGKLSPTEARMIFKKGPVSDAIIASYLTVIPALIGMLHILIPQINVYWCLFPYYILIAVCLGLIIVGDTALYSFWNAKIDASVFAYLRNFKGAFASVSIGYLTGAIIFALVVAFIFWIGAELLTDAIWSLWKRLPSGTTGYIGGPLIFVGITGILFIIIRGLKIRPNNPSVVYFSHRPFLNHTALNPVYNMIYSLGTRNEFAGKFRYMDDKECHDILKPLFPKEGKPRQIILKTDKPNILVIVWESFGEEFCGALGGKKDVTPCFNKLCQEGVLFTNCRASSFRTDRALPAIFCGLPGQPTTSIVRYTRKLPNLPAFPRDLRDMGYVTSALHAGDLTIMHKSDFYLASGHTILKSERDFPSPANRGKWGIHDGDAFAALFDYIRQLSKEGKPWMTTFQTLSSHEPFKVPYRRLDDEIDNAFAYTDVALGDFIDKVKNSHIWENLLLIIVADHGLNRHGSNPDRIRNTHIPMLWTGGAIRNPAKIDVIMSQSDLPATLLGQLGRPHDHFPFSRDVLAGSYSSPSSFHTHFEGFLFTDTTGTTDYDTVTDSARQGTENPDREKKGKAILQALYQYLDKL